MAEELPLDQNGHLFGNHTGPVPYLPRPKDREDEEPLILGLSNFSYRCAWCDAIRDFKIIDDAIRQPEPCPIPEGVTSTYELAFPSGKVVVSDDLGDIYRIPGTEENYAGYNSALGQHQVVEAMAKAGCAHGPVGNSCPGLYRTGNGTYAIASPEYDEKAGGQFLPEGWTVLTSITTNLWAYSIADLDDYLSRGGEVSRHMSVIDLDPGTYRFSHHTNERSFDHNAKRLVFAHIEKVN